MVGILCVWPPCTRWGCRRGPRYPPQALFSRRLLQGSWARSASTRVFALPQLLKEPSWDPLGLWYLGADEDVVMDLFGLEILWLVGSVTQLFEALPEVQEACFF